MTPLQQEIDHTSAMLRGYGLDVAADWLDRVKYAHDPVAAADRLSFAANGSRCAYCGTRRADVYARCASCGAPA